MTSSRATPKQAAAAAGSLFDLAARADNSWVTTLSPDPEAPTHAPNKSSRQVKSGHWVPVLPTPLPSPSLVLWSKDMADELGLSEEACMSDEFAQFFSGDLAAASEAKQTIDPAAYAADMVGEGPVATGLGLVSWCTPYALSIMGTPYFNNCPFGNGNGYGDGRAVSVGEVLVPAEARGPHAVGGSQAPKVWAAAKSPTLLAAVPGGVDGARRWELQLKGGGRTPFCRGADGRAVLRSSVREFLASEHMHALGVPTTRALSLVQSGAGGAGGEKSRRPWYSGKGGALSGAEPDMMVEETCAITCRVSPSFTRIGHLDLFSRRAAKGGAESLEFKQLEELVSHAISREYPHLLGHLLVPSGGLTKEVLVGFLGESAVRIASLMGNWLRVGFAQGNFNADNCLVGGRTMDYGPFGFMDEYNPAFAKWTGSGNHFAFAAQPNAGFANWQVLTRAVLPLLEAAGGTRAELGACVDEAMEVFGGAVEACWRDKLGFRDDKASTAAAMDLFGRLEPMMRRGKVDFTLFWRNLASVVELTELGSQLEVADEALVAPLRSALGTAPQTQVTDAEWAEWLRDWLRALSAAEGGAEGGAEGSAASKVALRLRSVNPSVVAREWLLVEAYEAAQRGDLGPVLDLQRVLAEPYAELSPEDAARYARRNAELEGRPGVAVMT